MFTTLNILFGEHYYLFIMFNFLFVKNNHLFVLLKYLFPVAENNYFIFKKYFWKIACKYSQVWSCFEDLVIRKMMVQSKFNLNARFKSYRFFRKNFSFHVSDVINFVFTCMHIVTGLRLTFSPKCYLLPNGKINCASGDGWPNHRLKWCLIAPMLEGLNMSMVFSIFLFLSIFFYLEQLQELM